MLNFSVLLSVVIVDDVILVSRPMRQHVVEEPDTETAQEMGTTP